MEKFEAVRLILIHTSHEFNAQHIKHVPIGSVLEPLSLDINRANPK
ncbi:hypothetical protein [Sulfolobus acidocaldarius]|nr:hypothetical protein [Sulfolobus acidocaldarius]